MLCSPGPFERERENMKSVCVCLHRLTISPALSPAPSSKHVVHCTHQSECGGTGCHDCQSATSSPGQLHVSPGRRGHEGGRHCGPCRPPEGGRGFTLYATLDVHAQRGLQYLCVFLSVCLSVCPLFLIASRAITCPTRNTNGHGE